MKTQTSENARIQPDRRAIGARIKAARKSRGWTQEALAKRIGANDASVCLWECGARLPNTETIVALAVVLRRSLDHLVCGVAKRGQVWKTK